jgi:mannose-1-phosphate guanylyltransferase
MFTYEDAIIEIMKNDKIDCIWFGNINLWEKIYKRKNGIFSKHPSKHPIQQWKAVYSALNRSEKFFISGYIFAFGFTNKETWHPVFEFIDKD